MTNQPEIKNIAILGSTGSIGTQTLDIIRHNPDKFKAVLLSANNKWELLIEQAKIFLPSVVVIANPDFYDLVKDGLKDLDIEVKAGADAISECVTDPEIDMVITAMVGYSGLLPTISAIKAGKKIGLANKETLVVAGEIISKLVKDYNSEIIPVDSEHSAIFQCLVGEKREALKKIILTASGGPFRTLDKNDLKKVKAADALKHPNWNMGNKVTIDSASMMNKGFEMIEAKWLFDCKPENITILVHPQSIVHSMVEFIDGSVKAQLAIPDMRLPIQYALSYPHRIFESRFELDWSKVNQLTFEMPDFEKFPLLDMAFEAIEKGGNVPCILNAANEVAVGNFLKDKLSLNLMPILAEYTISHTPFIPDPSLDDLVETNDMAVKIAQDWIKTHC